MKQPSKQQINQRWKNFKIKGVVVCLGYESRPCGRRIKRKTSTHKRCPECSIQADRIRKSTYKRNRRKTEPDFLKRIQRQQRLWYKKNRKRVLEQRRKSSRKFYEKLKDEVYEAYGGYKCQCLGCTVTEPLFLTLDHVKSDGTKMLKTYKERGRKMWYWIKKNGFPKGMFQVLCWNCNCGRARNNGICPHLKEKYHGTRTRR